MADNDEDKKPGEGEEEEQPKPARATLADVHERAMANIESAGDDDETAGDNDADGDGDGTGDDSDNDEDAEAAKKKQADADNADSAGAGDTAKKSPVEDKAKDNAGDAEDARTDGAVAPPEIKPPELEADDTTKPGKYKTEFTDLDGNKYYVTSTRDLPEDFEPKNQRSYGMAIEDLQDKRDLYKADQATYEAGKGLQEQAKAVADFKKEWATEQEELVREGRLPNDPAEREKAQNAIYGVMAEELKKDRVISFKDAYYRWNDSEQRRIATDQETKAAKDAADAKKKRGGKVMGGGTGGGAPAKSSNGSTVMEGKPPGTSLAEVHANVLSGFGN